MQALTQHAGLAAHRWQVVCIDGIVELLLIDPAGGAHALPPPEEHKGGSRLNGHFLHHSLHSMQLWVGWSRGKGLLCTFTADGWQCVCWDWRM